MSIVRSGLLVALLAAILAGCSQPAPPAAEPTAAPAAPAPAGATAEGAYPAPAAAATTNPAYPAPSPEPTEGPFVVPTPSSDQVGVISGVLVRISPEGERGPPGFGALYLGSLLNSDAGVTAMVGVDKATAPRAVLNSRGEFAFADVPPGRYGLMYDNLEGTVLLNDPETSGDFIIEVVGGQSQDLGELAYPFP